MRTCHGCKKELSIDKFLGKQKRCIPCASKRNYSKKCEKCSTAAHFGFESDMIARWCKIHADVNAINIKSRKCLLCNKQPIFSLEGDTIPRWCKSHAPENSIDINHSKYEHCELCTKRAFYGFIDENLVRFCKIHKSENAINIVTKKCEKCLKIATFGYIVDKIARWCKEHAIQGTTDVKHKTCEKCSKRPSFGFSTDMIPMWCFEHKIDNTINVVDKRCILCVNPATHGFSHDKKMIYCKEHTKPDCINLRTTKQKIIPCEHCSETARYGFESDSIKRWCHKHKKNNSINLFRSHCDECMNSAWFNFIGEPSIKCSTHKKQGMVYNPRKQCEKCKEVAIYGNLDKKRLRCEAHKINTDMLLLTNRCSKCNNIDILDKNNLCISICGFLPLYESVIKHQKKDEKRILDILTKEFGEPASYDKRVKNDCGYKERPDIVYDIPESKIRIIIEIDENGDNHGGDCSNLSKEQNELNRMINIFFSFGEETHTLFIRYNPNKYMINGVKQNINKTDREIVLIKWIKKFIDTSNDIFKLSNLAVLYLFYNEYNPSTIKPKSIDILKSKIYCCGRCSDKIIDKSNYNNIPRIFLFYDKLDYDEHKNTH